MTTMTTTTRWTVTVAGALVIATAVGLVAAAVRDDGPEWLLFTAFAVATVVPAFGGLGLLTGAMRADKPKHDEETVEHEWFVRATSGAFTDLLLVLGIVVFVTSVLDGPDLPLVLVIVLAMADVAVRYTALSRREA